LAEVPPQIPTGAAIPLKRTKATRHARIGSNAVRDTVSVTFTVDCCDQDLRGRCAVASAGYRTAMALGATVNCVLRDGALPPDTHLRNWAAPDCRLTVTDQTLILERLINLASGARNWGPMFTMRVADITAIQVRGVNPTATGPAETTVQVSMTNGWVRLAFGEHADAVRAWLAPILRQLPG
jgi:hypothetical protein